jgi:lipoprotein NlpI
VNVRRFPRRGAEHAEHTITILCELCASASNFFLANVGVLLRRLAIIASVVFAFLSLTHIVADENLAELIERASTLGEDGQHEEAVRVVTEAIAKNPNAANAYYVRGRENFRLARSRAAVTDFDKYIELQPAVAARQWERGIACYYAELYEVGAKQFESYQKFDGHDVENSVWRYLCLVPQVGVEKAKATMLPIENDRRVPMMQIYELFRGRVQPETILDAVRANDPTPTVLEGRMFYANLYLGLWYEAQGDKAKAKQYIEAASQDQLKNNKNINRYMWDVARVHKQLRLKK